jgi:hypothetical protein
MDRRILLTAVVLIALCVAAPDGARAENGEVDLLLVLAADVSRSVDHRKFQLQRDGHATAITDTSVIGAMTSGPNGRIALTFIEWSGAYEQRVVVDWTVIASQQDGQRVAALIQDAPRAHAGLTSISAAIDHAVGRLEGSPFEAQRKIINISGDGTNNAGRSVTSARDEAVAQGITINGLVILSEVPLAVDPFHTHPLGGLTAYYEHNVIGGPGAFVVEAPTFEAFEKSLITKLLKEIADAFGPRQEPLLAR